MSSLSTGPSSAEFQGLFFFAGNFFFSQASLGFFCLSTCFFAGGVLFLAVFFSFFASFDFRGNRAFLFAASFPLTCQAAAKSAFPILDSRIHVLEKESFVGDADTLSAFSHDFPLAASSEPRTFDLLDSRRALPLLLPPAFSHNFFCPAEIFFPVLL